jgi:7-cyano-7-deazaguanine reductase
MSQSRRKKAVAVRVKKSASPAGPIEVFANQHGKRAYQVRIVCPEFTAVCPRTAQPDFGTLTIHYAPDRWCLELKSLKLYLQQYRNRGIFYEDVVNVILDDLLASCAPRRMSVEGVFNARGGITTAVTGEYVKKTRARDR